MSGARGRKSSSYSAEIAERIADTMYALATPTRVQILACLLDGPHAVAELSETLEIEQSATSHQLRILRDHALVRVERVGKQRVYSLYDDHVVELLEDAMHHVVQRDRSRKQIRVRLSSR